MKLFIWEGVLYDYTAGMAVGYGETLEDVLAQFPDYVSDALGAPTQVIDCKTNKATIAVFAWGGG